MHGGGFVAGDKQYKNPLLSKIAEQGYVVVNVNYALAPNYKYPTPLKQMDAAVKFMKDNQHDFPIDFDQVILGGDSAGAQLMSQYTAMQTNDKLREEMRFQQQFTPEQLKGAIFSVAFIICRRYVQLNFLVFKCLCAVILVLPIGKQILKIFHKCRRFSK